MKTNKNKKIKKANAKKAIAIKNSKIKTETSHSTLVIIILTAIFAVVLALIINSLPTGNVSKNAKDVQYINLDLGIIQSGDTAPKELIISNNEALKYKVTIIKGTQESCKLFKISEKIIALEPEEEKSIPVYIENSNEIYGEVSCDIELRYYKI